MGEIRSPMPMRYPHIIRCAPGSTLSTDKEHSIRHYACTDVLSQQIVTGCRKAVPAISTCPEHHASERQARLPHGLFESLKSEEAQNHGAESTSAAKHPPIRSPRQAELPVSKGGRSPLLPAPQSGIYKLSLYIENRSLLLPC
jgi:hypothetical protein